MVAVVILSSCVARDKLPERPPGRDPAFEQEIHDRLAAISPDAVAIFQEATVAMDNGDPEVAKQSYEQVLELAPDFPDAFRRLSYVELQLGEIETALQHARQALTLQDSPYNHSALARALVFTEDPSNYAEALDHAWVATESVPDDVDANLTLLYAGWVNEDQRAVRQSSSMLIAMAPELPVGHFYGGLVAAWDGEWELAERELLLARDLGMPTEIVQEALNSGIASQARMYRGLRWGGYAIGAWLVGLLVLLLVGLLLSRLTLATVERTEPMTQFEVGKAERFVRSLYRIVISLAAGYFYASIPLVILIVVVVAVGVFYLFLVVGRIPMQLGAALLGVVIYTLVAVVRAIFARVSDEEPGRPLTREEVPELWSLVNKVAERVGTRPVDAIYVTPAASISVMERGSLLRKLRGMGRRCLIVGLGAIPGMTQAWFKAILAHEYGHFSGRDTAGGNLARRVHLAIHQMAYTLAVNGQARWYNPAWLFVSGFNRIFLRITLGASRLQEILADRYAAIAFGVQNLIDGLTHVIRQNMAFEANVNHKVDLCARVNMNLPNLYTPIVLPEPIQEKLDSKVEEEMSRPTLPYDSHPSPKERIRLLQRLDVTGREEETKEPVWDLLLNAEALQDEMMEIIRGDVRRWQQERAVRAAQRKWRDNR